MEGFWGSIVSDEVHRGRRYITLSDGKKLKCKWNSQTAQQTSDWEPVDEIPSTSTDKPPIATKKLYLILERQAEGEPKHWLLHASRGEQGGGENTNTRGDVWQVKGDAEQMYYAHETDADPLRSDCLHAFEIVAPDLTADLEEKVKQAVNLEAPPSAPSRREVRENCQGWATRVLWRLVGEGLVAREVVQKVETWMDPV